MTEPLVVETIFEGFVKDNVAVSMERKGDMTYVRILQIVREAKR